MIGLEITKGDLETQVNGTNRILEITKDKYYLVEKNNKFAYCKPLTTGFENIFGGYIPARELYLQIVAYNRGILEGRHSR